MTIVCVECGHLSNYSLKTYGDISSGHVRLAVCKACKKDVDKYLEYESLLLVLDLMLHRTAAFRHLLINRLSEVSPAISHLPASLSSIQTNISSLSTVSQSTTHENGFNLQRGLYMYEGVFGFFLVLVIDGYARLYRYKSIALLVNDNVFRYKFQMNQQESEIKYKYLANIKKIQEKSKKYSSCGSYGPDTLFPDLENIINQDFEFNISSTESYQSYIHWSDISTTVKTFGEGRVGNLFLLHLVSKKIEFDELFIQIDSGQVLLNAKGLTLGEYFECMKLSFFEWLLFTCFTLLAVRLFKALSSSRSRYYNIYDSWENFFSYFFSSTLFLQTFSKPLSLSSTNKIFSPKSPISSPATTYSTQNEANRHRKISPRNHIENNDDDKEEDDDVNRKPVFEIPTWSEQEYIQPTIQTSTISTFSKERDTNSTSFSSFTKSVSLFLTPIETWTIISGLLVSVLCGRCLVLLSLVFPFPPLLLLFLNSIVSLTSTICALRAILDCSILTCIFIAIFSSCGTALVFDY